MRTTLTRITALLIGVALLLTGQGLQGILVPVRASLESFGALYIGLIGGAYFLGFTLGCLKGGALVARVGHVRVFAAMTALASALPLLHGLLVNPLVWIGLRAITGFCFAVLYIVIESWLNDVATNENRGIIFSIYVMITMTVLALGQMMMMLYDPQQLFLFAVVAVLFSIAVIPVVMSTDPGPQKPHATSVNLRRLYEISPAGTIACLCSGLTNGAFWALAPAFAVAMSTDLSLASWFMTANVLGGAAAQWPIGWLSDRVGRRPMLVWCAVVAAAAGAAISFGGADLSVATLVLLGFAWGSAAFPLYAIAVANANDFAEPSEYVMVSSGLLLMYGIGAIAGPLLAAGLMEWFGAAALYQHTLVVHLFVAGYIIFRATQRPAPVESEHQDFADSMVAAGTLSQVYEEELQPDAIESRDSR
ncbi:MAG: MFS transporter [Woeseia sp.]